MILFIIFVIGIATYTIFSKGGLVNSIKEYNKEIERKIENKETNYYLLFSVRKYNDRDYDSVIKNIVWWILINFMLDLLAFGLVFVISAFIFNVLRQQSHPIHLTLIH